MVLGEEGSTVTPTSAVNRRRRSSEIMGALIVPSRALCSSNGRGKGSCFLRTGQSKGD